MFRDPIRRFADRLRLAGISTKTQEFPGMFHVFQILMPWAEASRAAFRLVRAFIREIVQEAPPVTDAHHVYSRLTAPR
jgi:acetyl esterase/lipase